MMRILKGFHIWKKYYILIGRMFKRDQYVHYIVKIIYIIFQKVFFTPSQTKNNYDLSRRQIIYYIIVILLILPFTDPNNYIS